MEKAVALDTQFHRTNPEACRLLKRTMMAFLKTAEGARSPAARPKSRPFAPRSALRGGGAVTDKSPAAKEQDRLSRELNSLKRAVDPVHQFNDLLTVTT
jgi:hypothetical protein